MASFSVGTAWDAMVGFVRRENNILAPVAMATFGVGAILLSQALPDGIAPGTTPVASARMFLMIPAMLALILGNLATSLLVLSPGSSVAEILRRAAMRLPVMVATGLLLGVFFFLGLVIISILVTPFAGNLATATLILTPLVSILLILFAAPALLLPPIIAIEPVSPIGALRRVLALVRGNFVRLFAVLCLCVVVMLTVSLIATVVVMVLTKLMMLVVGQSAIVALVGDIVLAIVSALMSMAIALYVAFAYRELAA